MTTPFPMQAISGVADNAEIRVALFINGELVHAPIEAILALGFSTDNIRLTSTGDVTLASTNHAFQIGPDSGPNLAADQNEIQARNNGAASFLSINDNGGDVIIGGANTSLLLDLRGGKIKFPATQVASADVNTLDDYEEGTWTPTLNFGGATTGITYSTRTAEYIKIGKFVFASFSIVLTSKGSATGSATFTGMPFAPATQGFGTTGSFNSMASLTVAPLYAAFTSTINIRGAGATGNTTLTDVNFTNTTTLNGSITFMVA
jgi:hypothetical protein